MADSISIPSNLSQIQQNYEDYKDYFVEDDSDTLGQDAFLTLMVEQMKNQDFMSPTDNSEYIAQMAQFSMVQEMQQMNYNTNASYATSLIGKTVTTSTVDTSSVSVLDSTGVVTGVKMNGTSFEIIVNGQSYDLKDITEVSLQDPTSNQAEYTDYDALLNDYIEALNNSLVDSDTGDATESEDAAGEETQEDTVIEETEEDPDYSQGVF